MTHPEASTKEETAKAISKAIKGNEKVKEKEAEREAKLRAEGMDYFFGNNNNFIPAGDEEFEGHYPGNQNNPILIPIKRKLVYGKNS